MNSRRLLEGIGASTGNRMLRSIMRFAEDWKWPIVVIGTFVAICYQWHYYTYPFGRNHCCDKQLYIGLLMYAEMHDGRFPSGGACPEASIAKIATECSEDFAYLLAGKSGKEARTLEYLRAHHTLTPSTCGWHYVEGLTLKDNGNLALFWDKEGLGHNAERLDGGGHIVTFVNGSSEHIHDGEWLGFLANQEKLKSQRPVTTNNGVPFLRAVVRLVDGQVVTSSDESYQMEVTSGTSTRAASGDVLSSAALIWWTLDTLDLSPQNPTCRLQLTLGYSVSDPVDVKLVDGEVVPNNIVFQMRSRVEDECSQ